MQAFVPEMTDVVILCGGRGTRLGTISAHRPKPLLPVGGRPFLLHVLLRLREEGFTRIILAAHYLAEQFEAFVSDHRPLGVELQLLVEPEPLGTGGALRHAASQVRSPVFVAMNGDSWLPQPVAPVLEAHERRHALMTVVVVRAARVEGNARGKGLVSFGPQGELSGFTTGHADADQWVNAGLYVLDRAMVHRWPMESYDLEARLMELVPKDKAYAFCSEAALLDIGTPDCYERATRSKVAHG